MVMTDDCDDLEYKFSIKAQNLESLELVKEKLTNFTLENAKSLVKAEMYLGRQCAKEQPDCAIQLLQGISVTCLLQMIILRYVLTCSYSDRKD